MADGLLSSIGGAIKDQYETTKRGLGLLVNDPSQFTKEAVARYFPTKEEVAQFRAIEKSGGDTSNTPYMQKMFNLAQFQGSIKPTGLLQTIKPEINMTLDSMKRAVLTENTNPNIVLTATKNPDNTKYMSPYLEVFDDPAVIGGKGTATRLYLKGLELAKYNNLGWMSDSLSSKSTEKMYQRLINMGIPFKKTGDVYQISPEELSKINLEKLIKK